MEISRKSRKSKFYCKYFTIHPDEQTANGCDWMWAFIFAVISLPFTWITMPLSFWSSRGKIVDTLFNRILMGVFLQFCLVIFVIFAYKYPIGVLQVFGVGVALCVLVGGIVYAIDKYQQAQYNKKYNTANNKPKEPWLIVSAYRSFKEKHCPKINWVD